MEHRLGNGPAFLKLIGLEVADGAQRSVPRGPLMSRGRPEPRLITTRDLAWGSRAIAA